MWTRPRRWIARAATVATLVGALAVAPPATAIESTLQGDPPLLLILVFPGMRGDALERTRRQGDPLMPRLQALASRNRVFTDCLTGAAVPDAGAFELLAGRPGIDLLARGEHDAPVTTGLSALVERGYRPVSVVAPAALRNDRTLAAAFPWAFGAAALGPGTGPPAPATSAAGLAVLDSVLVSCARRPGPQLVVFFADVLVPPYRLDDRMLEATDPAPWSGMREVRDLARNRSDRNRAARTAAEQASRAPGALGPAESRALAWAVDAAHAQADAVIGHVVDRLADTELTPRTVLVVTSTLGTATGGDVGTANGVSREDVHVPLLVSSPAEAPARIDAPVQLLDLATTLVTRFADAGSTAPGGRDLRARGHDERVRWSYCWWRRTEGVDVGFQGEARMTTSRLAFLASGDDRGRLYDLASDRRETVDLAPWEADLEQASAARLAEHLFGREPQVWILVKADPGRRESDGDLVGGHLHVFPGAETVTPDALEAMDVLEASAPGIVTWSFLADEGGDVVRVRLSRGVPTLELEVDAPGATRRWPLFVGAHAWPVEDAPGALSSYAEPLLRAIVPSPDSDIVAWAAGRPAGVYLWVVPSEGSSGPH